MYAENGEGENRGVENKGREEVGLPFLRRRWQPGTGARRRPPGLLFHLRPCAVARPSLETKTLRVAEEQGPQT
jgi:hypothetical protein